MGGDRTRPEFGRQNRLIIAAAVTVLFLLVAYILVSFIAVVVFSVFLYYAVRPLFRFLDRFGLGVQLRAAISIVLFGLPFLILIAYAVAVVGLEIRALLDGELADRVIQELNIAQLDLAALENIATGDQVQVSVSILADSVLGAAGVVGSVLVQLLLIVTATYYMLVDGPKLTAWLLDTYDDSGIGQRYVDEVDPELSLALFGNIVNVFVTAIVAIVTFYVYNTFVPAAISIPFPALLGALAGIGSLIPVVGIKLVYIPLSAGIGLNAVLTGQPELLVSVAVLFVVSAIIVDFIPDFVIRAQVSSDDTHTGALIIAYIVGPSIFGFYGLFFAPILLILTTNAVTVLLPYLLGDRHPSQTTLDEFETTTSKTVESED